VRRRVAVTTVSLRARAVSAALISALGVACRSDAPRSADGGPCDDSGDCQPGLVCARAGFTGTCRAEGFPCSEKCPEGLTCVSSYCWRLPRQEGQRCEDDRFPCAPGLVCWGEIGSCVDPSKINGQFCTQTLGCPMGLACNYGGATSTCGEPGRQDADCTRDACSPDLVCNQAFEPPRCRTRGAESDVCASDGASAAGAPDCQPGLVCNWAFGAGFGTGRCEPPGALDSACSVDSDCSDGLTCTAAGDGGGTQCR
jgi:hypothetical protein